MDVLEQAMLKLLNTRSFYANLMMQFIRTPTEKIPTAGVGFVGSNSRPSLYYNKKWLENTPSELYASEVLIHEAGHIIRDHIPRISKVDPKHINRNFHNVCADLAINCYLPEITRISNEHYDKYGAGGFKKEDKKNSNIVGDSFDGYAGVTTYIINQKYGINLKDYETYEYYVNNLYEHADKISCDFDSLDDHSGWNTPGDKTDEIKDMVRKAVARSAGNVPDELKEYITELLKSEVPWKKILRMFVQDIKSRDKESTRRRLNRRYGLLNPGKRKKDKSKIAVAVDTSGSMWNELPKVMSEVYEIAKHVETWIIEADCEVKRCYKADPNESIDFTGGGGTAYRPAFEKAEELGVSGLIYLGDMDCFDTMEINKPNFKVLWGIFGKSEPPASFGRKLRITD